MIQALLHYLIFTPSINIPLGFGDIETFPWALIFCLSPKLVLDRIYIYLMAVFGLVQSSLLECMATGWRWLGPISPS